MGASDKFPLLRLTLIVKYVTYASILFFGPSFEDVPRTFWMFAINSLFARHGTELAESNMIQI